MHGIGGSTLRGGQTVFHGLRMWGQLFRAAVFFAAFTTVAVPAWTLWHRTTGAEWYAAGMVTLAEVKLVLGYDPDSGQEIRFADGTRRVLRISEIAVSVPAREARERLLDETLASAGLGLTSGGVLIGLFLVAFWWRGARLGRQKRIRGAEMVSAAELRRRLQSPHERLLGALPGSKGFRPWSIAGIPYPERTETQHTIVSGTTGSGKTVLISDLVAQIRSRGERCVLYDKMGSYTAAFFDADRDVLMNPLDARAPRWSPFLEARNPRDFDMMAAALIPQQKDTVDPFWVTAARQLFSNGAGVFWKQGVTDNRVLVDHLLKTDLTALAEAMEGTVAQSIVDPENPKTALSVRAMLTANLGALEFLPDEGKPFSIREWISDEDRDGFLFLTSRGDQHASLRGLISTWLEIAVNAMLTLAQDDGRRIWVILDELPTLHQVPSLQPGLAESRQFGGCFVLGVQVASALRDLYGRNGAETISGLCGTRVVLAAPDRDTAQWSADSLGRSEVEEVAEGFSYGANTIRDGVSLTPRRETADGAALMALGEEVWLRQVRPLAVGTMIVAAFYTLFNLRTALIEGIGRAYTDIRKARSGAATVTRLNLDLDFGKIGVAIAALSVPLLGLYWFFSGSIAGALVLTLVMVVLGFLFAAVAGYLIGLLGSSNNPISGLTLSTLLIAAILMVGLGVTGPAGILGVLGVAGVVCCAAGVAGDMLQDLKVGHILGGTPWKMEVGEIIGVIVAALVLILPMMAMHEVYTIGSADLPAPQAGLMALMAEGIVGGEMAWPLVIAGMFLALGLVLIQSPSPMLIAVGMYLPFSATAAIFVGGIIAWLLSRALAARGAGEAAVTKANNTGVLLSSGFIAGEALMAVLLAFAVLGGITAGVDRVLPSIAEMAGLPTWLQSLLGALVFILLYHLLVRVPLGASEEDAGPGAPAS